MKWLLIALCLLLPFSALAGTGPPGCMSPTVVDGYVYFANDTPVYNANVSVTTTASECNYWYTQSEPSGYYGIPGLNIQGKTVTSTATVFISGKGTFDGINSSYSSSSTLRLNVVIRPSPPILVPIADRHNGTNVVFSWTSGVEPSTDATYDQFALLPASFQNKTSPQILNLTFGTYTWAVRTCNSKVCSNVATDSFNIYNTPPSIPVLKPINYTSNTSVILNWTSGEDTDILPEDKLIDELQVSRNEAFTDIIFSKTYNTTDNAEHSQNVSGLEPDFSTFYWRVRTCDDTGASNNCSAYAISSFFKYTPTPVECPPCPSCEERGVSYVTSPSYVVTLTAPAEVKPNLDFNITINFKSTKDAKELLFNVLGPKSFNCKPEKITNYKANTEQNVFLSCKFSSDAKAGPTKLTLHISTPSDLIVEKGFSITVLALAACGNNVCESDLGETPENCPEDCPIIIQVATVYFARGWFWILVLIIVSIVLIYKFWQEKKSKKKS